MDWQLRTIGADETAAFAASVAVPFFEVGDEDLKAHWGAHLELERAWVVVDEGRFVANACIFTRDMTVPAAPGALSPVIPIAAVSGVGVHPSHRRRGLLRRLMSTMLSDTAERGEAVAALVASESRIYGRFGFGLATSATRWTADTKEIEFATPPPPADLRLLDSDQATKFLPELFDKLRLDRAGQVNRNPAAWADVFGDRPSRRDGASANYYLAGDGGFAIYRIRTADAERWERNTVVVRDLYGDTPAVEAALWRFLFDLDLVRQVNAHMRPVDEILRWRMTDPRQLRVTSVGDVLWVCVLDVPAAFEARGYQGEGRLVIEVSPPADHGRADGDDRSGRDSPTAAAAGRWVLEAGPDGASCRRARPQESSDLRLGLADLGALYLGGVTASVLGAAGRVTEDRAGALVEADRVLAGRFAPLSGTTF